MIRVFLAASSPLAVEGLAALVQGAPDIVVIGRFDGRSESEETLSQAIAEENPDVLILELSPGQERADLKKLAAGGVFSEAAILLMAADDHSPLAPEAIRFGARGMLSTDSALEQLRAAIRAVGEGLVVLPSGIREFLRVSVSLENEATEELDALTAREREVLNLMASGLGNKQIATKLGISEHTAKFHVASILSKLGATTRTEAVAIGARSGLVLL